MALQTRRSSRMPLVHDATQASFGVKELGFW